MEIAIAIAIVNSIQIKIMMTNTTLLTQTPNRRMTNTTIIKVLVKPKGEGIGNVPHVSAPLRRATKDPQPTSVVRSATLPISSLTTTCPSKPAIR